MCLRLFFLVLISNSMVVFIHANEIKRSLKCMVYSGVKYEESKSKIHLIHITATGDMDVIHYLWSSHSLPSVIVARTTEDTNLTIDFEKFRKLEKDAITFSKEPLASTGFTITQLWENSYTSDSSEIKDINSTISLNLEDFHWNDILNSSITCTNHYASVSLVSSVSEEQIYFKNGSLELEFSVASSEKAASDYPHLMYSGNSTQVKVIFNNFYSNSSRVRYAMEMSVFAPVLKNCSQDCKTSLTTSVSDEFSPGIFSDVVLSPPCSSDSYLTWRPVAYLSPSPSVANSTDSKLSSECIPSVVHSPRSIAGLYFSDVDRFSVSAFNMTFGTKGDGFYPKTKYLFWSLMVGVGRNVGFKISALAIVFASIGIGSILLFIVGGLIFLGIQKCYKKEDDEKSLLSTNTIN